MRQTNRKKSLAILSIKGPLTDSELRASPVNVALTAGTAAAGKVNIRGTEFFSGAAEYDAKVTEDGEMATTVTERERNVWVTFVKTGIIATSYAILIDLDDTTNFPHDQTGRIDVSLIKMSVDRDATATGKMRMGVITRIDGTDADITYFSNLLFGKSDVRAVTSETNYAPSQVKLGVSAGALTRGVSNAKDLNVAAVNTGVTLESPRGAGTVTPAVGDVILKMEWAAGEYDARAMLLYHSEGSA